MYKCTVLNDKGGRVCVPLFYIRFSYIGIASIDFGSMWKGVAQRRPPFFDVKATLRTFVRMTLLIVFIFVLGVVPVIS